MLVLKTCGSLALLFLASDAAMVLKNHCELQGVQLEKQLQLGPVERRHEKEYGYTAPPISNDVEAAVMYTAAADRGARVNPRTIRAALCEVKNTVVSTFCPGGSSNGSVVQRPRSRPFGRSRVPARLP